jgi:glutamate-1-semialdehyde 2,1-aminomutase
MITGFRYARGGAQELFGVTPDLATFGKGLANGYPISALVGRRDLMALLEDLFFSFTFGGETLSLAAASAVLKKIKDEPVIETIHERGAALMEGLQRLTSSHHLDAVVSVVGHPSWTLLEFKDHTNASQWEIKTLFLQEMFYRGVITIGSHFPTYALSHDNVQRILSVYDEVFALLHRSLLAGSVGRELVVESLQPLFKVR